MSQRAAYELRLRGLAEAIERVREACRGEDIDAVAIQTPSSLECAYDLHEAYLLRPESETSPIRMRISLPAAGEVVGALALVRGAKLIGGLVPHAAVALQTFRMAWDRVAADGCGSPSIRGRVLPSRRAKWYEEAGEMAASLRPARESSHLV